MYLIAKHVIGKKYIYSQLASYMIGFNLIMASTVILTENI